MKNIVFKGIGVLLAVVLSSTAVFTPIGYAVPAEKTEQSGQNQTGTYQSEITYHEYLSQHAEMPTGKDTIILLADNITAQSGDVSVTENLNGRSGKSVKTGEVSSVTYRFTVSSAGLYQINVEYYPMQGKGSSIVRSFELDGKLPFEEVREVDFARRWQDKGSITQDANGNDVRPAQEESPCWLEKNLMDSMGYYTDPLQFYLSAGEHTVTVKSVKEPMAIGSIRLVGAENPVSYSEKEKVYRNQGLQDTSGYYQELQGEQVNYKSDASIYPIYDRSSFETVPNSASNIKLNTIGGSKWKVAGQWLEWEIDNVPEDGLYTIGIKGRQNVVNGAYSCRKLYVNGEIPFTEAEEIHFAYDTGWNMVILGDGENNAYRIPLKKGKNTLRLEVTLGELSELILQVNECVSELNNIYMQILMITGPSPDTVRDYQFHKQIPDTLKALKQQGELLNDLYSQYVEKTGQNGQQAQMLIKLARQVLEMANKPDTIASRFSSFASNITDMGNWLTSAAEQPLEIDYLVVASPDKTIEQPKNSLFGNLWFNLQQLVASFIHDYDIASSDSETGKNILVWVGNGATGGRDQAQVLQRMVSSDFMVSTGINVNVQLVSMGALLPATMSGRGPDVALTLNASDPLNYAIRHGVVDLYRLDGFEEVKQRFMESAMEPFSFDGGVYALPETQTFYMMFYRKDVLSELEIEIPQTWQDVVDILPVLQKKNLNFGLPSVIADGAVGIGFPAYAMFLFQHGGTLYSDNGAKSLLDSKAGIDAFYQWTKFYTDYSLPTQYDFMNRFRSGAVPIGIAEYSNYNTLQVFAPEIKGRWDFCAVPGTVLADGTIDRSSCGTTTGCVILSTAKDVESSWEFLKWWTGAEVQGDFGVELESILGAAGRYSPANVEALYRIPWSKSQYDAIMEQWKHVKGLREVPGSYMTSRFVDFAFRDAVNSSIDPDESIRDAVKQINEEIKVRRKEFGLSEN